MARHKKSKILWIIGISIFIILIGAASFLAYLAALAASIPDPGDLGNRQINQSTKIYDRTGEILLYEVYGKERRTVIPFSEIPEFVYEATIALEDQTFYAHNALDYQAIIRSVKTNILRGELSQGGSTITQQLAKNTFLSPEKTLNRKFKELLLALWLEKNYTKNQILELYLNQIPYGTNAYGVEAASLIYFKKSTKYLNLAEAATLASLLQAPTYYSPWGTHLEALMARKNYTLNQMQKLGFIDEEQKTAAENYKLEFATPNIAEIKAPHFVMYIQEYLNNKYGEEFIRTSGLKVITTLNWDLQEKAEKAVYEGALRNEELYQGTNAALVTEDSVTGQILALVGSRDYFDEKIDGQFNVATQGLRQPGSTLKPFIYLSAFEKGYTPETILFDLRTEFDATGDPQKSYKPQNFDEQFKGPITMKEALAESRNIPAVKTLYLTSIKDALETAHKFGIGTLKEKGRYGLSLVLGGGEVKLIDLVSAYSTLSRDGEMHPQSFILNIEDNAHRVLEKYENKTNIVADPQYPRLINEILSDINLRRPLFSGSLNQTTVGDHEIALKTGTTNDYRDAWAIGYTPELVIGVWAGNNDNSPMQKRGSSILAAVPIWNKFAKEILKDKIPINFTKPEPVYGNKPVLRGQYLVNYEINGLIFPQVHEILYYVKKDDPLGDAPPHPEEDSQFHNWEEPVLEWTKINIASGTLSKSPSFGSSTINLEFISPENGGYIQEGVPVEARINSLIPIKKIELYFNALPIDNLQGSFGNSYIYKINLTNLKPLPQNLITLKVFDENNLELQNSIILFKQ